MGSKRPNDGTILMMRPLAHDPSVPHAFNHTGGECPKCGSKRHHILYCLQGQTGLPKVVGCEVDGEHLHRQCGDCGYPWIERCYDHAIHSQEEGVTIAESQLMSALAALAHRSGGISLEQAVISGYRGWTIRFTRDADRGSVTITAEETPPSGEPAHPEMRPAHQPGNQPRGRAS